MYDCSPWAVPTTLFNFLIKFLVDLIMNYNYFYRAELEEMIVTSISVHYVCSLLICSFC